VIDVALSAIPDELLEERGWTAEAIERLELGFDGERVVFPVRGSAGEQIGFTRYLPGAGNAEKMRADKATTRELFPPPEMIGEEEGGGLIWLVEGEPDCVRAWSLGLPAVAVPGAGNWRAEWAPRFTGRRIVVCFDADEAGRTGAARAAGALAAAGITAHVLDLDTKRDDGFDLSDFTAGARSPIERLRARKLLERCADVAANDSGPVPEHGGAAYNGAGPDAVVPETLPAVSLEVVPLAEFAAVDEPGAAALVGNEEGVLIPENGDVMFYGDGGAGKTTLAIDLAFHLAAGQPWLNIAIQRPARVLLVENEGPRPLYRQKLRRKHEAWDGRPVEDRITVVDRPWACLSFAEPTTRRHEAGVVIGREALAAVIRRDETDVVIVGPVTRSGMNEAGTLQEVRDFMALVARTRELSNRRVAFVLIHHENKGGKVSGAWEGAGDTLFHVQGQGHGRTRLFIQKARWSSEHHAKALHLVWAAGDGFAVEERVELDDDAISELIEAYVREHAGTGWTKAEQAVEGARSERLRQIRDGMLSRGELVNVVKGLALDTIEERRPARLYVADDPSIQHLLQGRDAGGTQSESLWGAGEQQRLRPASRPLRDAGVDAAASPPYNEWTA
jgi:hypothetical protein